MRDPFGPLLAQHKSQRGICRLEFVEVHPLRAYQQHPVDLGWRFGEQTRYESRNRRRMITTKDSYPRGSIYVAMKPARDGKTISTVHIADPKPRVLRDLDEHLPEYPGISRAKIALVITFEDESSAAKFSDVAKRHSYLSRSSHSSGLCSGTTNKKRYRKRREYAIRPSGSEAWITLELGLDHWRNSEFKVSDLKTLAELEDKQLAKLLLNHVKFCEYDWEELAANWVRKLLGLRKTPPPLTWGGENKELFEDAMEVKRLCINRFGDSLATARLAWCWLNWTVDGADVPLPKIGDPEDILLFCQTVSAFGSLSSRARMKLYEEWSGLMKWQPTKLEGTAAGNEEEADYNLDCHFLNDKIRRLNQTAPAKRWPRDTWQRNIDLLAVLRAAKLTKNGTSIESRAH